MRPLCWELSKPSYRPRLNPAPSGTWLRELGCEQDAPKGQQRLCSRLPGRARMCSAEEETDAGGGRGRKKCESLVLRHDAASVKSFPGPLVLHVASRTLTEDR